MSKQTTWKKVAEERYWEMMEVLPPAHMCGYGFLVGEPMSHRQCAVTGNPGTPTFSAFIGRPDGHYECTEALTFQEYRAINPTAITVQEDA